MGMARPMETRIIMMSPALMKLYDVHLTEEYPNSANFSGLEYQPITFCDPQECLDMLIDSKAEDGEDEESGPEARAEVLEKQWGELELRLSFFTDAFKWQ